MTGRPRAWVEVDLSAVAANVAAMAGVAAPARLCAVVKADAYGHGALPVARTALASGASWLAVANASEAAPLRASGVEAPILLLQEPASDEGDEVVALGLRPTVYTPAGVEGLAKAVGRAGSGPLPVHLKVDTGMHRVGACPAEASRLAAVVADRPELALEGVWTHCAVADRPDDLFTVEQAERFAAVLADLRALGARPTVVHAANSAAAFDYPALRYDMVRCGITVYGLDPSPALNGRTSLRPALSLKARVSLVKVVAGGEALSYGQRHRCKVDSVVATVPLGYADGVPRRLSEVGGNVLVGGRRRPMAGTVTMDQLLVDCGPAGDAAAEAVAAGDEVVLLGRQEGLSIGAQDWADALGTIPYEVVCAISSRVPRRYEGGAPIGT